MYTLDMLREHERRYEGPVSMRFLAGVGMGAVAAALLLVMAYFLLVESMLLGERTRLQATWDDMQTRYAATRALQQQLAAAERYAEEIDGWERSRSPADRVLLHLQREIPASVQLVRLEWRDAIEPPPRAADRGTEGDPMRRLSVFLSGRVTGAAGEDTVTRLIRRLQEPDDPDAPVFRTATLVSLQRDGRIANDHVSVFDLDIAGFPREIK